MTYDGNGNASCGRQSQVFTFFSFFLCGWGHVYITKPCLENKCSDHSRLYLYRVRKLYPPLGKSGCSQWTEACAINAWEGSAATTCNLNSLWELFFMYNDHGWARGLVLMFGLEMSFCLKTTTTISWSVIHPVACTCSTWLLLLQRGFNGALFSLPYH